MPTAMLAVPGETAIETRLGDPTLKVETPLKPSYKAVMVMAPCAIGVTKPGEFIEADDCGTTDHETEVVRFWVLPSV